VVELDVGVVECVVVVIECVVVVVVAVAAAGQVASGVIVDIASLIVRRIIIEVT
jgi:hypothetical protein